MNFYDIFSNEDYGLAIDDEALLADIRNNYEISVEARNVLLDKFVRINQSQVYIADRSVQESVLVFSFEDTYRKSLDIYKNIKYRTANVLINKMKIFFIPKRLEYKLPSNKIILTNQSLISEVGKVAPDYGVNIVAYNPSVVKEASVVVDYSSMIQALRRYTIDKNLMLTSKIRSGILEYLKKQVTDMPIPDRKKYYKNTVIYFKGPYFTGTNIKMTLTEAEMKKTFRPALLFIEWYINNPDEFKKWLSENNITLLFESIGNDKRNFIMSKSELQQNTTQFNNSMYILKSLHILDGVRESELTLMNSEEIMTDDKVEENTPINILVKQKQSVSGNTLKMSPAVIDKSTATSDAKIATKPVNVPAPVIEKEVKKEIEKPVKDTDKKKDDELKPIVNGYGYKMAKKYETDKIVEVSKSIQGLEPDDADTAIPIQAVTDEIEMIEKDVDPEEFNLDDKIQNAKQLSDTAYIDEEEVGDVKGGYDHYQLDNALDDSKASTRAKINEIEASVAEIAMNESTTMKNKNISKDYFGVLARTGESEEEIGKDLLEVHNYTDLKKSIEDENVVRLRQNTYRNFYRPLDEVVDTMKKHSLKPIEFNNLPADNPFSVNVLKAFDQMYHDNLMETDLDNILVYPAKLSYPSFLQERSRENIVTTDFYGTIEKAKYVAHNGTELDLKIKRPTVIDGNKIFINGSLKTISRQEAAKPVTKFDDKVMMSTAYKKTFLQIQGKYATMEDKIAITTLKNFAKQIKGLQVKTTPELGNFIYKNLVSYRLIHLNKHFAGILTESIDIDFAGKHQITSNEEIEDFKATYPDHAPYLLEKKTVTLLGHINFVNVYHTPEDDMIYFDGKQYSTLEFILGTVRTINPDVYDEVKVTKASLSDINYIYAEIMQKKIPVILVLMCAAPLKEILEKLRDNNELTFKVFRNDEQINKLTSNKEYGVIRFADRTLVVRYANPLNELLLTPLVTMDLSDEKFINITTIMTKYVGNINTQQYIENWIDGFIDPDTERVLALYGQPTEFVDLWIYAASLLTSYKTSYTSDANNYRLLTVEEVINRITYDVLATEFSANLAKMKRGSRPNIHIDENAVIRKLQDLPNISESAIISPFRSLIDDFTKSHKGHYGRNKIEAYKDLTTRFFNENNFGTETSGTAYTGTAGINKFLPVNPVIKDLTGRYESFNESSNLDASNLYSVIESFVPYLRFDSAPRVIMTNAQFKHPLGVKDADPMIISSGFDESAIYMTPDFAYIAKDDGEIVEINHKFVKIKYKNGTVDAVSLDNVNRNADKGYHIKNDLIVDSTYHVGSKIKKNTPIAYNPSFYRKKSNGKLGLSVGPYVHCLVCDDASVWEDSTVVSATLSNKLQTKVVKRIARKIHINTDLREYITEIGREVSPNTTLFKYKILSDDAAIAEYLINSDDISLKEVDAHYRGKITDIRCYYRLGGGSEISKSVDRFLKELDDAQRVLNKMSTLNDVTDPYKKMIYNSKPQLLTGGVESKISGEVISNGQMLIEYYIEIEDNVGPADKLVVSRALKQEPSHVLADEDRPVGTLSGKKIDMIFDTYSCLARMTAGMILEGTLNLIMAHIAIKNRMYLNIPPEKNSLLDFKSSMKMVRGEIGYK